MTTPLNRPTVPLFDRRFFDGTEQFTRIGSGGYGGKAHSLLTVKDLLAAGLEASAGASRAKALLRQFDIQVPTLTVVTTDLFETFMDSNHLWDLARSGESDHRIALAFQAANLPVELLGDLYALIRQVHTPLAVRSSSLLEDALNQPFAGVYATKMIPNNQLDVETRFHRLVEAIKFVYASTFFENARNYRRLTGHGAEDRMAVILQAIVGCRHQDRFYPELSGVARWYSFYRSGNARPEDGVVNLAFGLGKTIVDGGVTWSYSPTYPRATPPYSSVRDLLRQTQLTFWSVNMGKPPAYDPVEEAEYLVSLPVADAEKDETLRLVASTYDGRSDRLSIGVGINGPRALTFAPLLVLEEYALNDLLKALLRSCQDVLGAPVEIEFAVTFPPEGQEGPAKFGFLQVRPMTVSDAVVDVDLQAIDRSRLLIASERVMGNGLIADVRDVVYVKPEGFEARNTPAIASQIAHMNVDLVDRGIPYLLVGFGRWGSSDPWLGIPVTWSQIGGAKAIVEATLPTMNVDLSQGSHFFHNISSFNVSYFSVPFNGDFPIDWEGLSRQDTVAETEFVRHVRLQGPLHIAVDGRQGHGANLVEPERPIAMNPTNQPINNIIEQLQERAKELHTLYKVHELINQPDASTDEVCRSLTEVLPGGWQYPSVCWAKITLDNTVYQPPRVAETPWAMRAEIIVQGEKVGSVEVFYTRQMPRADEGPFLKEERKLIDTIAERLGHFMMQRRLQATLRNWQSAIENLASPEKREWWVIIEFLRKTDQHLLMRISRRMLNYLCWNGIDEAQQLLHRFAADSTAQAEGVEDNTPLRRKSIEDLLALTEDAFRIAATHLSEGEIVSCIQKWIKDDKSGFLVEAVENQCTSLTDIGQALERYHQLAVQDEELSRSVQIGLRVSLARRFFTEDLEFINTAKNYIEIGDFYELVNHIISPPASHGKLGGKSAGMLLASQIIRKCGEYSDLLAGIKVPKTWYIASDGLMSFVECNQLEDVYNRKYLEIEQIRREYPHIVQVFKNSRFAPEIMKGLSQALDDLEGKPLIVRSSSLLEDRMGAAFSGKYKSLFLPNIGTKGERLSALMDAIAEVYASLFGPDPIEYRAERNLLDLHEEMGIMIQEVVGTRVGPYFMPSFAGVAFSNNEFRWSPRIKRDDGLVRIVPGLGTRAVDRVGDDYPILVAPGQPGLRVNVTPEEILRYAPRKIDVINLETQRFETVDAGELFREYGREYPALDQIASVYDSEGIHRPVGFGWDPAESHTVVTFDGLISSTPFMAMMRALLKLLRERIGSPVDIEFASDGRDLYLLQCRPQSFSRDAVPSPIPRDVPFDRVIFAANKYVSNGRVPDVTHVVYVDPNEYDRLEGLNDLKDVGRIIGRLNKLLPKRQFILMGPGRWGSRGDIKLGVSVTYSDINNTAVLIEIAAKKGNYVPDLSFGTHFFQDLVEAGIRYLPLFPGNPGQVCNELFLRRAPNILGELVPEYAHLSDVVHVIDMAKATDGLILQVLMNADLDEALGYFAPATLAQGTTPERRPDPHALTEDHWRWRLRMAEHIAAESDPARFGIKGMYVFGSTKNATAGPGSDIDLIVHVDDAEDTRHQLEVWLEGWSLCLSEMNYLRTGYRTDGMLDVKFVTDVDFKNHSSFASKIGAITDPARALQLRRAT